MTDLTPQICDALERLQEQVEERRPEMLDLFQRLMAEDYLPLSEGGVCDDDAELLALALKHTIASAAISETLRLQLENASRKAAAPWN